MTSQQDANRRLNRPCKVCQDGLCPTKTISPCRANYFCVECGRDVSMAALLIAQAMMEDNEHG